MTRNDFKENISQAIDEMKKEQGDSFDLSKINLDVFKGLYAFLCYNFLIDFTRINMLDSSWLQIPLKQHAVSDRTACCSASSGTE